jgi:hypothetical protein
MSYRIRTRDELGCLGAERDVRAMDFPTRFDLAKA